MIVPDDELGFFLQRHSEYYLYLPLEANEKSVKHYNIIAQPTNNNGNCQSHIKLGFLLWEVIVGYSSRSPGIYENGVL